MSIKVKLKTKLSRRQEEIVSLCQLDSLYKYITVCCGRQVGKSSVALVVALKWAITNEDYRVGIFLPVYSQCKNLFKRMSKMLKGLSAAKQVEFNGSEYTITFNNGSIIKFHTADNDNCRSFTYDSIIVDEACFIKDDIWNAAIRPTVAVSLSKSENYGKVLLLSTPKTKNWFYGMVNNDKSHYKVIRFTSEQGGLISKEYLEDVKKDTPDSIFRNEYMGEFLDSGNGLFRYLPCVKNIDSKQGIIAALDIGIENDYTALTIMDKDGNVIYINRWRQQSWDIIAKTVIIELKKHGSPICHVETNGIGKVPYQDLLKSYSKVKPWFTTNANKNDMVQKLMLDFNTKNISIPDNADLKDELDAFTIEYKNGNAVYGGSGGFHDDYVISLAICNYNRSNIVSVKPQSFKSSIKR